MSIPKSNRGTFYSDHNTFHLTPPFEMSTVKKRLELGGFLEVKIYLTGNDELYKQNAELYKLNGESIQKKDIPYIQKVKKQLFAILLQKNKNIVVKIED